MVIEYGPQPPQSEDELIWQVAGALYSSWFLTTVNEDGQTRAEPDFSKLSQDEQRENRQAAAAVIELVRTDPELDLRDPGQRLIAGSFIHDHWIARNGSKSKGPLGAPFGELSAGNQAKDLVQYGVTQQMLSGRPMIVHGFPGVGKTQLAQQYPGQAQDLDASRFANRLIKDNTVPNPQFPYNYVKGILHTLNCAEVPLVSTHAQARALLAQCGLQRTVVFPDVSCRREYRRRYKTQGVPGPQIDCIMKNWDGWIDAIQQEQAPYTTYVKLGEGEYLSDVGIVTGLLQQPAQETAGI